MHVNWEYGEAMKRLTITGVTVRRTICATMVAARAVALAGALAVMSYALICEVRWGMP